MARSQYVKYSFILRNIMKKISINNHWNSQLLQRIWVFYRATHAAYENHSILSCALRVETFRVYTTSRTPLLCYVAVITWLCVCVLQMCVCVSCACSTPRLASKFQSKAQTKKNEQQQRQAHFPSGQHESEIPFITLCTWCCCLLLLVLLLSSCFKWNCLSSWNFLRIM